MTDSATTFAETQQTLSNALFRLWMQPLEFTQAALAAGSELISRAGQPPRAADPFNPGVIEAAEEKIAYLDEEIDRFVPAPAGIVA